MLFLRVNAFPHLGQTQGVPSVEVVRRVGFEGGGGGGGGPPALGAMVDIVASVCR